MPWLSANNDVAYRASYLRIVIEIGVIGFVYVATAFKVWDDHWVDAHRTLFLQSHVALILFEEGVCSVRHIPMDNVAKLCSPMVSLLMGIQVWGLITDSFMLVNTGEDFHDHHRGDEFIIKITMVLVATVLDIWRVTEILMVHIYFNAHGDEMARLMAKQQKGQPLSRQEEDTLNNMSSMIEMSSLPA